MRKRPGSASSEQPLAGMIEAVGKSLSTISMVAASMEVSRNCCLVKRFDLQQALRDVFDSVVINGIEFKCLQDIPVLRREDHECFAQCHDHSG